MARSCLHLLVSLFALFGAASASAETWSKEKTTFAAARMQTLIGPAKGQAPAVSVGVSINGSPVFATGAGNAFVGNPANENTGYHIGSLSKQLTAATMLALIEKKGGNGFSLDTRVMDTLPDSFPFSKSNKETIRNLLTQRTGYADYTHPPATAVNVPDLNAPIERSKLRGYVYALLRSFPAPLSPPPGAKFTYNNTNYYLTSLMIEKLGAFADYRDAMKQYVFQPSSMTKSGFVGAPPSGVAIAVPPNSVGSFVSNANWPRGAGDVVSTASDVLKWHSALMSDKVLGKVSRGTMFTAPGDGYAMGWAVSVTPPYAWINHGGIISGYTSFDGIFINGTSKGWVSVVVLSSNDDVPVDKLGTCLAQLAMDSSATLKDLNPLTKLTCGISNKMFGP